MIKKNCLSYNIIIYLLFNWIVLLYPQLGFTIDYEVMNNNAIEKQWKEVLYFWFSETNKNKWYIKSESFDNEIKEKFEYIYNAALQGKLESWMEFAESALALIIVLDQFPRNMYRNTSKAFASDEMAIKYAKMAIEKGLDKKLNSTQIQFMYMPFMHSENKEDQEISIQLFSKPGLEISFDYAKQHKAIIDKFGRYPHRNKILERNSTKEEIEFLKHHSGF